MANEEFQILKQRSLYSKLKRLFSTDAVIRNIGGKKLKVVDTDEVMYATDRNTLRDRFNRVRTSSYNQYSRDFTLSYQAARIELFRDYDTMDMDPIISSALDIYADECVTKNELGEILIIHSSNDNIKQILYNLFYDILNIEFNMWSWTRNLVKYGDFYLKMYISPEYGVYMVEPISAYNVTRVENSDITNKNYVKFQINLPEGGRLEELENYQVAHFRMLSDSNFIPYGKSIIEGGRRVWKQLSLMEDAMLIHRVMYATDRNTLRDRFNRVRTSSYNQYSRDFTLSYQAARIELFRDYDTMDMDPIISSALDIYADECVTKNELGEILIIHSSNDNIKQILYNLFYDILNIEFNMWSWTRNLVKYGDFYLKMYISPEYGVYMVEPISAYNVTRVENSDITNKNYVKFQINLPEGGRLEELENYQVAHFRMLSDSNFIPYGKSIIEGGRRVWKQLSLMEDAMLIHRVMRAPEKRIFKVDVGNIPPGEVDQYMQKLMDKMKKVPYIDERTGDYNLRFNLQNMVEDFYLPVRGSDSGTSIEPLSGMEFNGIDDIEYLRNKMLAALKIPKAFLGYEEDLSGKATLASEDIRFAKTVNRVQRILISELNKIAMVHLYAQGYKDSSLVDFTLELTNPSVIFEKEKIGIWQDKVNLSKDMMETKLFSKKWIYENVFKISEEDSDVQKNDLVEDAKQSYRFKQIEEEGIDPAKPFNKIKSEEDSGESGGGEMGSEPDAGGGPDDGGSAGGAGGGEAGGAAPEAGGGEAPALTEKSFRSYKRPSQKGSHKKRKDNTFGYDPLGSKENVSKSQTDPLRQGSKSKSSLSLEGLSDFLKPTSQIKSELLNETKSLSMLDEKNIIE